VGPWFHVARHLYPRHVEHLPLQFELHAIPAQPPSVQIRPGRENLFLRKQLALYQERQVHSRRATDATRLTVVLAARLFDWKGGRRRAVPSQRWMTFVRNHAKAMVACDFFVSVTFRFQIIYVLVMMEVGSRRLVHFNVTSHPTAVWALQQFWEAIDNSQDYRFLIHDRDSIFSQELDVALRAMGVKVLKTPFRSPQANSHCERLIGSLRRDCLDFLIPIKERHLKGILKDWKSHYGQARPHARLGPGLPEPGGGLHHEYRLENVAA